MRHARMAQATICERPPTRRPFLIERLHRNLQEDDEGRARTTAHAHPALRHVEPARQPARRLQRTQQNPSLAFEKPFLKPFPGAGGRQQRFNKKVALHGKADPGPPRGGAGGPVVPAATSGDLRGGVQRRTDVPRAHSVQTVSKNNAR